MLPGASACMYRPSAGSRRAASWYPNIEEEGGLRYFTLWQVMQLSNRRARNTESIATPRSDSPRSSSFVGVRTGATSRSASATILCGSTACGGSIPSASIYRTGRPPSPGNRGHRGHRSQSPQPRDSTGKSSSLGGPGFVKTGARTGDSSR